jgi:hypothetical protein
MSPKIFIPAATVLIILSVLLVFSSPATAQNPSDKATTSTRSDCDRILDNTYSQVEDLYASLLNCELQNDENVFAAADAAEFDSSIPAQKEITDTDIPLNPPDIINGNGASGLDIQNPQPINILIPFPASPQDVRPNVDVRYNPATLKQLPNSLETDPQGIEPNARGHAEPATPQGLNPHSSVVYEPGNIRFPQRVAFTNIRTSELIRNDFRQVLPRDIQTNVSIPSNIGVSDVSASPGGTIRNPINN